MGRTLLCLSEGVMQVGSGDRDNLATSMPMSTSGVGTKAREPVLWRTSTGCWAFGLPGPTHPLPTGLSII
ncbi:putative protein OS=Streptomyces canus OX=58343 GN=AQI96_37475 PE=4 SV=1 [Streptomyces canus]